MAWEAFAFSGRVVCAYESFTYCRVRGAESFRASGLGVTVVSFDLK